MLLELSIVKDRLSCFVFLISNQLPTDIFVKTKTKKLLME